MSTLAVIYGSRDWPHVHIIRHLLVGLRNAWGDDLVLLNGRARSGADDLAYTWARELGIQVEEHVAQWMVHDREGATAVACSCPVEGRMDHALNVRRHDCPLAGYRRNQAMVDREPRAAFGFRSIGKSNGTDDMTERLEAAGIPTTITMASVGPRGADGFVPWPLIDQRPLIRNRRASEAHRLREPRSHRTLLDVAEEARVNAEVVHVTPRDDLVEHVLDGTECLCGPTVEPDPEGRGLVVIHHALDGRA